MFIFFAHKNITTNYYAHLKNIYIIIQYINKFIIKINIISNKIYTNDCALNNNYVFLIFILLYIIKLTMRNLKQLASICSYNNTDGLKLKTKIYKFKYEKKL